MNHVKYKINNSMKLWHLMGKISINVPELVFGRSLSHLAYLYEDC